MFPSEYEVKARQRELIQQAKQHHLAREAMPTVSLSKRAGQQLLKLGARFAANDETECVTIETRGQTVTVCPA